MRGSLSGEVAAEFRRVCEIHKAARKWVAFFIVWEMQNE